MKKRTILIAAGLALMLVSTMAEGVTTSDADPPEATGSGMAEPAASAPPDTAAAAALVKVRALFAERCVRCHGGKRPAAGLSLATDADMAALTGTAAAGRDSLMLVVPGRPEASYLLMKINGSDGIIGNRMPLAARALSDEDVRIVEEWIRSMGVPDTTAQQLPTDAVGSNDGHSEEALSAE